MIQYFKDDKYKMTKPKNFFFDKTQFMHYLQRVIRKTEHVIKSVWTKILNVHPKY
jgi:hypothetical protein